MIQKFRVMLNSFQSSHVPKTVTPTPKEAMIFLGCFSLISKVATIYPTSKNDTRTVGGVKNEKKKNKAKQKQTKKQQQQQNKTNKQTTTTTTTKNNGKGD